MNDIDLNWVEKQLNVGETFASLAKKLGTYYAKVSKLFKESGRQLPHRLIRFNKNSIDPKWIAEEIRSGETYVSLAKKLGTHRSVIASVFEKAGFNRRKIIFNENYFGKIDSSEKAYWLGFMYADGCVSMTHRDKVVINLAGKDEEHLIRWHEAIGSCLKVRRGFSNGNKVVYSQHYSSIMCQDLIKLGCMPKKSLKLKFPTNEQVPEKLVFHFIRGYFDGDGCASLHNKWQKRPQLRLSLIGTKDFLTKLKEIIEIDNKLRLTGNNKKVYCLQINGNKKSKKIADLMYKDATICLERKKKVIYGVVPIPVFK